MTKYHGSFTCKADVEKEFDVNLSDYEIVYAIYETESYEGTSFVLATKDGILYEIHGSHCSCYGLEGQWEPEETNIAAIEERIKAHWDFSSEALIHLVNILLVNIISLLKTPYTGNMN